MMYVTIHVVHAVGGVRNTVQQYNPHEEAELAVENVEAKNDTFRPVATHRLSPDRPPLTLLPPASICPIHLASGFGAERN
jgi:hypothetical protein